MPHDPIGRYPGRKCFGIMHALSAAEAEGECDALGEIAGLGRLELVIGHGPDDSAAMRTEQEHSKGPTQSPNYAGPKGAP